jgi:hypothetical protein
MKTELNSLTRKAASALLVTLITMCILATTVAGYLYYVQQQVVLSKRSQGWNMAMAVAEAGLEEGLQALNLDPQHPATTMTAAGWNASGSIYWITRQLPSGQYYVTNDLSGGANNPVLTARGYVNATTLSWNNPGFFFAAANVTDTSAAKLTRAVRVKAHRGSLFLAAIAAKNSVKFNGNFGYTDSFDSADPLHSSNGMYSASVRKTNGDVASLDGVVNAGNYDIYGHVYTGPNGTFSYHNNGGADSVSHDANFTFPDTTLPSYAGFTPVPDYSGGNTNGNISTLVSAGSSTSTYGSATPPSVSLGTNQTMTVVTNSTYINTNNYPGSKPGLTTNTTVKITQTNRVPVMISSNLICSATEQSGNSLPASGVCSWYTQGNGHGAVSYRWTTIVGTNTTWQTNLTYNYSTNSTYTYQQITYDYTIYTAPVYSVVHYDHIICGNMYTLGALSGSTLISCPSDLIMPNGFNMGGGDKIEVGPNGSVELHTGGSSMTINSQGVVNTPGYAANFIVYATTNVTSVDINGNGSFTGVLVAPGANVKYNGGGSDQLDFIGAIMANTVTLNGHFSVHYDEVLGRRPGDGRYLITSWKELQ